MKKNTDYQDLRFRVAPSLLAANPLRLAEEIDSLEKETNILHVDVMDGHYVPNMNAGPSLVAALAKETDYVIDVHLMVEKPDNIIDAYIEAGADILTIHQEATFHPLRWLSYIRNKGVKAGISINPGTSLTVLNDLLPEADLVLLMTVNPGFGGQKYIKASTDRIRQCREMINALNRPILLEADGGLGMENAQEAWEAGLDIMVAGSAVFGQDNRVQALKKLRKSE